MDAFYSSGFTTGGGGGDLGSGSWIPQISLNLSGSSLTQGTRSAAQADPEGTAVAILNQAEVRLQQNLADYMGGERTFSRQQVALKVFDDTFAQVKTLLSDSRLGAWGSNGLRDRLPGGQYDWTAYYRTPIAQDRAAMDVAGVGMGLERALSGLASPWIMLIGIAAIATIALVARKRR